MGLLEFWCRLLWEGVGLRCLQMRLVKLLGTLYEVILVFFFFFQLNKHVLLGFF